MYMEALRMENAENLWKGRKALLQGCHKLGDLRLDEPLLHTPYPFVAARNTIAHCDV